MTDDWGSFYRKVLQRVNQAKAALSSLEGSLQEQPSPDGLTLMQIRSASAELNAINQLVPPPHPLEGMLPGDIHRAHGLLAEIQQRAAFDPENGKRLESALEILDKIRRSYYKE